MQRLPHLLRVFRRPNVNYSLFGASSLLLGIWGTAYLLSSPSRTLRLDSEGHNGSLARKLKAAPESLTRQDASNPGVLAKRKALEHFKKAQYAHDVGRLHEHESSVECEAGTGIARYDVVQIGRYVHKHVKLRDRVRIALIASNDPTEDDHAELAVPVPNGTWSLFAVFDGHNGWETSAWLRENMLPAVVGALSDLYSSMKGSSTSGTTPSRDPSPEEIEKNVKQTFQRLDDDIVHDALERALSSSSRHIATNILAPAYAGSAALVAFYDSHSHLLHVALTGDSRAVLGRRVPRPNGKGHMYEVRELSVDQNGSNPAEESRIGAAHPGELVIKGGRVMGWGLSRAFGDARWKWDAETQTRLKREYLGRSLPPGLKTPPYLIAEPEVTCTEVRPGDFLILASDGLWESLTSNEAVGLTGWWLDNRSSPSANPTRTAAARELPIDAGFVDNTPRCKQWNVAKVFIDSDSNAATHLVRNALGGANADLTSALLSMRAPRSRSYMDDITAIVVFFRE